MRPVPLTLRQETRCHGVIDGEQFEFVGGGRGRPYDGFIDTDLSAAGKPVGFEPHLFDVILIMGYPTFSRYLSRTHDLFKLSDGYEYERHMTFANGGRLDSVHRVGYQDDFLSGDFEVTHAEVGAPPLVGIEPIVETFIPDGPGRIRSHFVVAWNTADGGHLVARCESEYRLTHNAELPQVQFRYIDLEPDHTPERLRQSERLTVMRTLEDPAAAR